MELPPGIRAGSPRGGPLAAQGEDLAASHLEAAGLAILGRNLQWGKDEVDLLALCPGGETALVEVKTRADATSHPEERVDRGKRRCLLRFARRLLAARPGLRVRFDVVAVNLPEGGPARLVHFPHAFDASLSRAGSGGRRSR